jgi:hypothetical protein
MNVKSEVETQFRQVADQQEIQLAPLTDGLALFDTGLDSLGFALVIVKLEATLGVDPFSGDDDFTFPVTFGDFVRCYEMARGKSISVGSSPAGVGNSPARVVEDAGASVSRAGVVAGSVFGDRKVDSRGGSVLVATADPLAVAAALVQPAESGKLMRRNA